MLFEKIKKKKIKEKIKIFFIDFLKFNYYLIFQYIYIHIFQFVNISYFFYKIIYIILYI